MRAVRYGFVCASAFALVCYAGVLFAPAPVAEQPANVRDGQRDLAADVILRRILAKRRLVEEVASGRLSLFDAASLFRHLDQVPPSAKYPSFPYPDMPLHLPSPTEEGRYCAQVIVVVRNVLMSEQPDRAGGVTKRLVAEFEAARRLGPIRLPDPGSLGPAYDSLPRGLVEDDQ